MKSLLMMLLAGCLFHAHGYAQGFTLSDDHDSLVGILKKLAILGKFEWTYADEQVRFYDVSVHFQRIPLDSAIGICLGDFPLKWTVTRDSPLRIGIWRYPSTDLEGWVKNSGGEPIEGLSVLNIRNAAGAATDREGRFHLTGVTAMDSLRITGVGIQTKTVSPGGRIKITIRVDEKRDTLHEVTVYHDGYQDLPQSLQPPGSIALIAQSNYQKGIVSSDILSPLTGRISGLMSGNGADNSQQVNIRGISTLFASRDPLLIVDQFPFDGNPQALNPYDVESVTALKDASSSALWGARSANGVLVYTFKKGTPYKKGTLLTLDLNTVYTGKPDLFYNSGMGSSDFIDVEQQFFAAHLYDGILADGAHPAVSPVVDILDQLRSQRISPATANALIQLYRQHDSRNDLRRLFFQPSIRQQHHFSLTTGNADSRYYLSFGYDNDPTTLRRNGFGRMTLHNSYSRKWRKWEFISTLHYANIRIRNNNPGASPVSYPYAFLDQPVNIKYPTSYTDTAGNGRLMNWAYIPEQELDLADNSTHIHDLYAQADLRIRLTSHITGEVIYRHLYESATTSDRSSKDGFYMRDLINRFTDLTGPEPVYPVPMGDLLATTRNIVTGDYWRAFLQDTAIAKKLKDVHSVFQAGLEGSQVTNHMESHMIYGYDDTHPSGIFIDPVKYFPDYITGNRMQIPYNQESIPLYTRYLSFFADLRCNWKRLSFYAAAKKDGANIVGVETNHQWSPFWAVAAGYDISRTSHDTYQLAPQLKLRLSAGTNGNVGSRTGFLVTEPLGVNEYGAPQSGISNPPDPRLKWEQTLSYNIGLDLAVLREPAVPQGRLYGSFDAYRKHGTGLFGSDTLPPSSGLHNFFGNAASLRGAGFDFILNSVNIMDKNFQWTSGLLFSYNTDKVSTYPFVPDDMSAYTTRYTPRTGYPSSAIFSYRAATLGPAKGNPRGYLHDTISEQYNDIVNGNDPHSIVYSGPGQPRFFGSLQNTFVYKKLSLYLLLIFKGGFVLRRPSIDYYGIATGTDPGNTDYSKRWLHPGDEKKTFVPAPPVENDLAQSIFYTYSSPLITSGAYIRVQQIRLSYELSRSGETSGDKHNVSLYLSVFQPFLLWKANHHGLDPEAYTPGFRRPAPGIGVGLHMEL